MSKCLVTAPDKDWLDSSTILRDGVFICKKCGKPVEQVTTTRPVHRQSGRYGEPTGIEKEVTHFFDSTCFPGWTPPENGQPIYGEVLEEMEVHV